MSGTGRRGGAQQIDGARENGGGTPRPGAPAHGDGTQQARGRARLALGVLMVAGTALSALLLRPEGRLFHGTTGPLGGNLPVLLLAAAWFAVGLMVNNHYQSRIDYDNDLNPLEQRLVDIVRMVLLAAVFVVPFLLIVLHRFRASGHASGSIRDPKDRELPQATATATTRAAKPHHGKDVNFPPLLQHILIGVGIGLLALLLVVAAVRLLRYLRVPQAGRVVPGYEAIDDDRELLAEAVESGRRALRGGLDARAAVIACYAAMEESLAASGVARRASDSPRDLLQRAVAAGVLHGPSAEALTRLFREARYSTHPMGDDHRDRAAAALNDIAAQLAAREQALGDSTGQGPAGESGDGRGGAPDQNQKGAARNGGKSTDRSAGAAS
ncbi:protein of unknown function [Actinacidiphila alni]|uniref:Protein-glutamine gamma-glutamyltransferase-like C-terminal domain-containing protein n=1 Tax=Actinacidiphila alni TaxID=380248 RepID=A0A1I2B6C8_9ACTN|nr:DUF4129 domain-containing protein [Actinacidiphila alni]SFE51704.1 protein of unknown function [Actinacidiphila alni]